MKLLMIIMGLGLFLTGCAESEKKIEQMRYECEQEGIIDSIGINLSFPDSEAEKLKVMRINRIKEGKVVESFIGNIENSFVLVNRNFYTKDTYEFIIEGNKPFILSEVKTQLEIHNPMFFGESHINCGIKEGKINGKLFRNTDGGILLQK